MIAEVDFQISEALRKFGMNPSENHFLAALFDADDTKVSRKAKISSLLRRRTNDTQF